jgi:hypothetical protein
LGQTGQTGQLLLLVLLFLALELFFLVVLFLALVFAAFVLLILLFLALLILVLLFCGLEVIIVYDGCTEGCTYAAADGYLVAFQFFRVEDPNRAAYSLPIEPKYAAAFGAWYDVFVRRRFLAREAVVERI